MLATSITLFTIALLFLLARTVIRCRYQRQLLLDDIFLFFGVLCLCAAFGPLMLLFFHGEYTWSDINKIYDAYFTLTYSTLFSVKLSFLFFFRNLLRRAQKMIVYWWTVLAIIFIAWPVSILAAVAPSCPIFGVFGPFQGDFGSILLSILRS